MKTETIIKHSRSFGLCFCLSCHVNQTSENYIEPNQLFPFLSVYENLELVGCEQQITYILDQFKLNDLAPCLVKNLTEAEQLLVLIMRGKMLGLTSFYLKAPDFLDRNTQNKFYLQLKRLAFDHHIIVYTNDIQSAYQYADQIWLYHQNRLCEYTNQTDYNIWVRAEGEDANLIAYVYRFLDRGTPSVSFYVRKVSDKSTQYYQIELKSFYVTLRRLFREYEGEELVIYRDYQYIENRNTSHKGDYKGLKLNYKLKIAYQMVYKSSWLSMKNLILLLVLLASFFSVFLLIKPGVTSGYIGFLAFLMLLVLFIFIGKLFYKDMNEEEASLKELRKLPIERQQIKIIQSIGKFMQLITFCLGAMILGIMMTYILSLCTHEFKHVSYCGLSSCIVLSLVIIFFGLHYVFYFHRNIRVPNFQKLQQK